MTEVQERPAAGQIHAALIEVMRKIGAVAKLGLYEDNRGTKYNFRGIDAVVNAAGPALREVGVIPVPKVLEVKRQPGTTNSGGSKMHTVVKVRYRFTAADGSYEDVEVEGEANDNADKGTGKAMSVAYRIALLQLFSIPTDDPDPDASHIEGNHTPPLSAALAQYVLIGIATDPIEHLERLWALLTAHVPGDARIPDNPDGRVWWEQFAMRYRREVEEAKGIEGLNELWKKLGPYGRTFRVGGSDVGQLIKDRGAAWKKEAAEAHAQCQEVIERASDDEAIQAAVQLVREHYSEHRITSTDAEALLGIAEARREVLAARAAETQANLDSWHSDAGLHEDGAPTSTDHAIENGGQE